MDVINNTSHANLQQSQVIDLQNECGIFTDSVLLDYLTTDYENVSDEIKNEILLPQSSDINKECFLETRKRKHSSLSDCVPIELFDSQTGECIFHVKGKQNNSAPNDQSYQLWKEDFKNGQINTSSDTDVVFEETNNFGTLLKTKNCSTQPSEEFVRAQFSISDVLTEAVQTVYNESESITGIVIDDSKTSLSERNNGINGLSANTIEKSSAAIDIQKTANVSSPYFGINSGQINYTPNRTNENSNYTLHLNKDESQSLLSFSKLKISQVPNNNLSNQSISLPPSSSVGLIVDSDMTIKSSSKFNQEQKIVYCPLNDVNKQPAVNNFSHLSSREYIVDNETPYNNSSVSVDDNRPLIEDIPDVYNTSLIGDRLQKEAEIRANDITNLLKEFEQECNTEQNKFNSNKSQNAVHMNEHNYCLPEENWLPTDAKMATKIQNEFRHLEDDHLQQANNNNNNNNNINSNSNSNIVCDFSDNFSTGKNFFATIKPAENKNSVSNMDNLQTINETSPVIVASSSRSNLDYRICNFSDVKKSTVNVISRNNAIFTSAVIDHLAPITNNRVANSVTTTSVQCYENSANNNGIINSNSNISINSSSNSCSAGSNYVVVKPEKSLLEKNKLLAYLLTSENKDVDELSKIVNSYNSETAAGNVTSSDKSKPDKEQQCSTFESYLSSVNKEDSRTANTFVDESVLFSESSNQSSTSGVFSFISSTPSSCSNSPTFDFNAVKKETTHLPADNSTINEVESVASSTNTEDLNDDAATCNTSLNANTNSSLDSEVMMVEEHYDSDFDSPEIKRIRLCAGHQKNVNKKVKRNNKKDRNVYISQNFETHPSKERRILYVSKIEDGLKEADFRKRFEQFGPVQDISLHFRENGNSYGFVTYCRMDDVFRAMKHGNDDPNLPKYMYGIGGRREFCGKRYIDLDASSSTNDFGNFEYNNEVPVVPLVSVRDESYESLLKQFQKDVMRRKLT